LGIAKFNAQPTISPAQTSRHPVDSTANNIGRRGYQEGPGKYILSWKGFTESTVPRKILRENTGHSIQESWNEMLNFGHHLQKEKLAQRGEGGLIDA
jgi:hypothetical protein